MPTQALIEFNLFTPIAIASKPFETRLKFFKAWWDSEEPRLGEGEGFGGWSEWLAAQMGQHAEGATSTEDYAHWQTFLSNLLASIDNSIPPARVHRAQAKEGNLADEEEEWGFLGVRETEIVKAIERREALLRSKKQEAAAMGPSPPPAVSKHKEDDGDDVHSVLTARQLRQLKTADTSDAPPPSSSSTATGQSGGGPRIRYVYSLVHGYRIPVVEGEQTTVGESYSDMYRKILQELREGSSDTAGEKSKVARESIAMEDVDLSDTMMTCELTVRHWLWVGHRCSFVQLETRAKQ